MAKTLGVVSMVLTVCILQGAQATIRYVDGSVAASGNGQSWQTAFKKIQQGIDAAAPGDTVVVAPGNYVENIEFKGKNILLRSTDALDSAVVANTVIDGDGWGFVVTFSGTENETCVLAGFTIRNGYAHYGAGIRGGTRDTKTQATIRHNVITGNVADGQDSFGGGLAWCGGTIENNTITGNTADWGGGLCECPGTIQSNVITGNAGMNGSGLHWCDGTIQSNVVSGNVASGLGGGVNYCWGTIRNNTVVGNSAVDSGGGFYLCSAAIQNNVVWENRAPDGAQLSSCSAPSHSCIQSWSGGVENISQDPQFVTPGHWDTKGTPGDPSDDVWVEGNYHLKLNSPCIDAGDNSGLNPPGVDRDGDLRIALGRTSVTVDMGAYEYNSPAFQVTELSQGAGGALEFIWRSQPNDSYTVWSRATSSAGEWAIEETTVPSQGAVTSWIDYSTSPRSKLYKIEMQ